MATVGEQRITYDARGLAEPQAEAPRTATIEDGKATFDAHDLSTRQINLELRRLLYEEGIMDVTVRNPGAKHSLGVGILTRCKITFDGSLGYFGCGLIDGPEIRINGRVGWSACENMMSGVVVVEGNAGSLTGATFYKKFDSYIVGGHSIQTIGGIDYDVSSPDNTGAGHLDGAEVSYQQFYDNLPGVFSGLGLQANVTFMEGQALYNDYGADYVTQVTVNKALQGLSKWSYNVVLLYEKNGWTGRLAYNWRSGFPDSYLIVNLPTTASDPFRDIKKMDLYARESSQLDGYLGYQLNSKVTLTLEGTNLTDSRYKDYRTNRVTKDKNLYIRDTRRYDRTIEFGVRVKM